MRAIPHSRLFLFTLRFIVLCIPVRIPINIFHGIQTSEHAEGTLQVAWTQKYRIVDENMSKSAMRFPISSLLSLVIIHNTLLLAGPI